MKVNLSKINLKEPPVLFLKNQSEKIISPMIGVMNFSAELNYNEISPNFKSSITAPALPLHPNFCIVLLT